MELRVLTWNLFHGRDSPPEPGLYTWRSRLLGRTERGHRHVQVNHELLDEFSSVLSGAPWDVAFLQECPPRWAGALAAACGAAAHESRTSRNRLAPLRWAIARRNPDLMGSWEGGSNLTLVRGLRITERDERVLCRRPERRTVAMTRLAAPGAGMRVCIANLHASTGPRRAEADIRRAADAAVEWAGNDPLVLGGDLNLRPEQTGLFDELASRLGLRGADIPDAIDHLLGRGLEAAGPPLVWPEANREVPFQGLAIRLSDHAPVERTFQAPARGE